ncbi:MAG TPA: hypothetical protein VL360_03090 [Gammaproteobacteria bacterium]|jgi:hypothetical protein|nr:hypothetical protein [Gammaproteobacteria bacterium]
MNKKIEQAFMTALAGHNPGEKLDPALMDKRLQDLNTMNHETIKVTCIAISMVNYSQPMSVRIGLATSKALDKALQDANNLCLSLKAGPANDPQPGAPMPGNKKF